MKILADLGNIENKDGKPYRWCRVQCGCGAVFDAQTSNVTSKKTTRCKDCRIIRNKEASTTHGLSKTPGYSSWLSLFRRVNDPKHPSYEDYKHLSIDPRWNDVRVFFADMGERPPGTSIDRKDNEKGYWPDNCRWATPLEQTLNRRERSYWHINGRIYDSAKEAAAAENVNVVTIRRWCYKNKPGCRKVPRCQEQAA